MTLDETYAAYKAGKFLRRDLFGVVIDHIKELQSRIGAVDEAKVASIDTRLTAMETTIGNALRLSAELFPETAKRESGSAQDKAELRVSRWLSEHMDMWSVFSDDWEIMPPVVQGGIAEVLFVNGKDEDLSRGTRFGVGCSDEELDAAMRGLFGTDVSVASFATDGTTDGLSVEPAPSPKRGRPRKVAMEAANA